LTVYATHWLQTTNGEHLERHVLDLDRLAANHGIYASVFLLRITHSPWLLALLPWYDTELAEMLWALPMIELFNACTRIVLTETGFQILLKTVFLFDTSQAEVGTLCGICANAIVFMFTLIVLIRSQPFIKIYLSKKEKHKEALKSLATPLGNISDLPILDENTDRPLSISEQNYIQHNDDLDDDEEEGRDSASTFSESKEEEQKFMMDLTDDQPNVLSPTTIYFGSTTNANSNEDGGSVSPNSRIIAFSSS